MFARFAVLVPLIDLEKLMANSNLSKKNPTQFKTIHEVFFLVEGICLCPLSLSKLDLARFITMTILSLSELFF